MHDCFFAGQNGDETTFLGRCLRTKTLEVCGSSAATDGGLIPAQHKRTKSRVPDWHKQREVSPLASPLQNLKDFALVTFTFIGPW
eukprot:5706538-Pleurochrysis_carterae.AAC.4